MSTNVLFTMQLRGIQVAVDCAVYEPDYSVGITSRGVEEWNLTDVSSGDILDWELTDAELLDLDFAADTALTEQEDIYLNKRGFNLNSSEY